MEDYIPRNADGEANDIISVGSDQEQTIRDYEGEEAEEQQQTQEENKIDPRT